jgi:hypothetical protein
MTMFVRVSGGAKYQLQPAFIVFQSPGKYPIRGVDDNVPGASYRVGRKGWMDRHVMAEYLSEKRANWPLPNFKKRFVSWITVAVIMRLQIQLRLYRNSEPLCASSHLTARILLSQPMAF